jgi:hypothetical protein
MIRLPPRVTVMAREKNKCGRDHDLAQRSKTEHPVFVEAFQDERFEAESVDAPEAAQIRPECHSVDQVGDRSHDDEAEKGDRPSRDRHPRGKIQEKEDEGKEKGSVCAGHQAEIPTIAGLPTG